MDWTDQKNRYDHHQNSLESQGYVQSLEKLLVPLRPFLQPGLSALDWGCGPGSAPVLAEMIRGEGLVVDLYDPIYQPNLAADRTYDLVTSTEVIEHFQKPRESFDQIFTLLRPIGLFAGLTQFHQGPETFPSWWYPNDPTHVIFFSEKTFHWMAGHWDLEVVRLESPAFIFRRLSQG